MKKPSIHTRWKQTRRKLRQMLIYFLIASSMIILLGIVELKPTLFQKVEKRGNVLIQSHPSDSLSCFL